MELSLAFVTFRVALPEIVPTLAEMSDVPGLTLFAKPCVTVATLGALEVHFAVAVMSTVLPSLKLPRASRV
jgi:hypothetical protein